MMEKSPESKAEVRKHSPHRLNATVGATVTFTECAEPSQSASDTSAAKEMESSIPDIAVFVLALDASGKTNSKRSGLIEERMTLKRADTTPTVKCPPTHARIRRCRTCHEHDK